MYHVVVVKDEGVELEQFNSLESAIENAEANTEDSEVVRIGIFRGFTEIAEWFVGARTIGGYTTKSEWYYLDGDIWKKGHPEMLSKALNGVCILRAKGNASETIDCEVDCIGKQK